MNEKKTMNIEQFKDCARELIPVLEAAKQIIDKYGCGKYLRMTVTTEEYLNAEGDALGGWSLSQYKKGEPYSLKYEYTTKVRLDGESITEEAEEVDEDA